MLNKDEIIRYDRQIKVAAIGSVGQQQLKQAKILIIGAGGLGCPALQYLSAAGVGNITVIDGDTVSESNLQRQILFNEHDLGKPKAEVAVKKAALINPHIHLRFINEFLSVQLALKLFPEFDLILDCCDNFGTRYLVNDVCLLNSLPFVSSALFRTEGQLGTFNVLQNNGTYSASYRDFFPDVQKSNAALDCNEAGVIATLPGIMGIYQANEVIKYFTHKEQCCINKLMMVNIWDLTHFQIAIDPADKKTDITKEQIESSNYQLPCKSSLLQLIGIDELKNLLLKENTIIVDVREEHEFPEVQSELIYHLPLSILEKKADFFSNHTSVIFVCKSGVRSKTALGIIQKIFPDKDLYSFKHGIELLIQHLPPNQSPEKICKKTNGIISNL